MNTIFYAHAGSGNHGCEAIVRSTSKILGVKPTLFSYAPHEEMEYAVDKVCRVIDDSYVPVKKGTFEYLLCALDHKVFGHYYQSIRRGHKTLLRSVSKGDICLSIGGDNYCYSGTDKLAYYNTMLRRKGCRTVLWGCSIEPSVLTKSVVADLKSYELITVRESLSYEGLVQAGITDNILMCADPAFQLDIVEQSLPDGFTPDNTIGVNVSPLAADCGNLVMENYIQMIRYILENTENRVLLIPHVVKPENDDRKTLQVLYDRFRDSGRIALLEDRNCMELKGIICQCRMFIGARTHATIAAYSTCVPTLVAGYSIKARGIAKDIFGTDENYVVPVQNLNGTECLKDAFIWLQDHEEEIRQYLRKTMPGYKAKALIAGDAVQRMRAR